MYKYLDALCALNSDFKELGIKIDRSQFTQDKLAVHVERAIGSDVARLTAEQEAAAVGRSTAAHTFSVPSSGAVPHHSAGVTGNLGVPCADGDDANYGVDSSFVFKNPMQAQEATLRALLNMVQTSSPVDEAAKKERVMSFLHARDAGYSGDCGPNSGIDYAVPGAVLQPVQAAGSSDGVVAAGGSVNGKAGVVPSSQGGAAGVQHVVVSHLVGSAPINEYVQGHRLLAMTYPTLFFLGSSSLSQKMVLKPEFTRYLMMFADHRFATNHMLVFHLFDQFLRHAVARSVHARVKGSNETVARFFELAEQANFTDLLRRAIAEPSTKTNAAIIRTINAAVQSTASNIQYSPERRRAMLSNIIALTQFTGLPCYFITIAPAATGSACPFILRCADAMGGPDDARKSDVTFPIPSFAERVRIGNSNPAAAAEYFGRFVEVFLCVVLGLEPASARKSSNVPVLLRSKGLFGRVLGYVGVVEETKRGAEHLHIVVVVDGLTPEVLQKAVEFPDLVALISAKLDSLSKSSIPVAVSRMPQHDGDIADGNREMEGASCTDSMDTDGDERGCVPAYLERPAAGTSVPLPTPGDVDALMAFDAAVCNIVDTYQHHRHTLSCWRAGLQLCRYAFPQPCVDGPTMPLQLDVTNLFPVRAFADIKAATHFDNVEGTNPLYPFPVFDDRLIVWQQHRPSASWVIGSDRPRSPGGTHYEAGCTKSPNAYVVSYVPVLSAIGRCNTAPIFLWSASQSASASMYVIKYVTKSDSMLTQLLTVAAASKLYVNDPRNASVAPDAGTIEAQRRQLMNHLVNHLPGWAEVSVSVAAAAILGCPSEYLSHSYWFCFPMPAIHAAVTARVTAGIHTDPIMQFVAQEKSAAAVRTESHMPVKLRSSFVDSVFPSSSSHCAGSGQAIASSASERRNRDEHGVPYVDHSRDLPPSEVTRDEIMHLIQSTPFRSHTDVRNESSATAEPLWDQGGQQTTFLPAKTREKKAAMGECRWVKFFAGRASRFVDHFTPSYHWSAKLRQ